MVRLNEAIMKAQARAEGSGIAELARVGTEVSVKTLAPASAIAERRLFLERTEPEQARMLLERVLGGNEIQPVNYLERGMLAQRAVCRISIRDEGGRLEGYGTGFLVSPGLLLTNNHVLPNGGAARKSLAEFDFQQDLLDAMLPVASVELEPDRFFETSMELDFSLVALKAEARDGRAVVGYGYLPLIAQTGKVLEGEWLTIVQHPDGTAKKVCVRENRLLKRDEEVIWYSTDTMGGSSGSPVFNNEWQVVALHHSGVPEIGPDGRWMTWRGTPYDPEKHGEADIKWVANEGIRVSRIINLLRQKRGADPELAEFFARAGPEGAAVIPAAQPPAPDAPVESVATARRVTVTLEMGADGAVRVCGQDAETLPAGESPVEERTGFVVKLDSVTGPVIRSGYDPAFLGGRFRIPRPLLNGNLGLAAPLLAVAREAPTAEEECLLNYHGYSLVMNRRRRLAIYSAANVSFWGRNGAIDSRTSAWQWDDRIAREHQLGNFYYAASGARKNRFDRGHLTRNEDMEYSLAEGEKVEDVIRRARDSFYFTNCGPQHESFNQSLTWSRKRGGDGRPLWQGLERLVLEDSIVRQNFRAMVITGPVLDEGDPVWDRFPGIQYPLKYWKLVVGETASGGNLFATAFLMDQSDMIRVEGLERVEIPAAFQLFQVPVAEIERLTGLGFTAHDGEGDAQPLSAFDTLERPAPHERRASVRESAVGGIPTGYVPLKDSFDIVLAQG